jgi:hypothetical protein
MPVEVMSSRWFIRYVFTEKAKIFLGFLQCFCVTWLAYLLSACGGLSIAAVSKMRIAWHSSNSEYY